MALSAKKTLHEMMVGKNLEEYGFMVEKALPV